MMWGYYNPWMMLLLMLIRALVWFALLAAVIWVIVRLAQTRTSSPWHLFGGPSAIEVLRQRYAHGEIDAVTFDDMCARLEARGADERQRQPAGV